MVPEEKAKVDICPHVKILSPNAWAIFTRVPTCLIDLSEALNTKVIVE